MINWMYFPQNKRLESHLNDVLNVFVKKHASIASDGTFDTRSLNSDSVLAILAPELERIGYAVGK